MNIASSFDCKRFLKKKNVKKIIIIKIVFLFLRLENDKNKNLTIFNE